MMTNTWYEVAVSSKKEGSATIESFGLLEKAIEFASSMCNDSGKALLEKILHEVGWADIYTDDIECLFIDRWICCENKPDKTFTELKYYPRVG